jgi:hypothetical protein
MPASTGVWKIRYAAMIGVGVVLSACGGPTAVAPPPPSPRAGPVRAEPGVEIPLVATDTIGGQRVAPPVFGVDLDTVRAGEFDQGKMWTFEFPPTDYFAETYGFRPDEAWFEKARLGAQRIPSCSASFVSRAGLVMTNHHCAREFVTQVQQEGESLLDHGFYATDLADERAVEDFEADQLVEIVDVTEEVNGRLDGMAPEARGEAREGILEEIEERLTAERGGEDAGIVVEMVSLYNGGRTSAYVFRRYTNAKLVMAPELQIGFFGGDPDNFTYPRYNLDVSFFRLYDDDGAPLQTTHYFPVDDEGLEEGDAVFIIGNPGSTSRLQTVAELEYRRDVSDRFFLALLRSRMEVLDVFIRSHPEEAEARDLRNQYFSLSNTEKSIAGQLAGLEDPVILARRRDTERTLRTAIGADPTLRERYGDLIDRLAAIQREKREVADVTGAFVAFGNPYLDSSALIRALWATQILIGQQNGATAEDLEGPLESFSEVPQTHPELDAALLAARIADLERHLGAQHPSVRQLLQGRSPGGAAEAIIAGSALADSAQATELAEQGTLSPQDPAIQAMIAMLEPFVQYNNTLAGAAQRESAIAAELGRARLEVFGTQIPPDATFSLRIADGVVQGYDYNGTRAPWYTTFYGLYNRHYAHAGVEDWALPERWMPPPPELELSTPLNFVSTVDIIGGNSGSPVLDEELEVVGVVFDGNIESLPGDYIYLPELNRSVTVDIRAVLEALDHVYDMDRLVLELRSGRLVETEAAADQVR